MTRIVAILVLLSTTLLLVAFVLGMSIGDQAGLAGARRVGHHLLTGLAALIFASFVHSLVLTYFLGTGRWVEDTSQAYSLDSHFLIESRRLKYRTLPAMVASLSLLILTGVLGALSDPAAAVRLPAWGASLHLLAAIVTIAVHLLVGLREFSSIDANGRLIDDVMREVRRMRAARGLPIDA